MWGFPIRRDVPAITRRRVFGLRIGEDAIPHLLILALVLLDVVQAHLDVTAVSRSQTLRAVVTHDHFVFIFVILLRLSHLALNIRLEIGEGTA
jgi:hypothetical protein